MSLKDSKGNVTTALPDGKSGFTSTVTDKNGKVISLTSTTYDAKGGSTSMTTDKNGKIISSTVYDKLGNVVPQTGKQAFAAAGPGSLGSAVTPTSQGSVKA